MADHNISRIDSDHDSAQDARLPSNLPAVALRADARADHLELTANELTVLLADLLVQYIHAKYAYEETLQELWRERRLRERTEARLRELLQMPESGQ